MGGEKGSELSAAKLRIQELEVLVASLYSRIQILESQNTALRTSPCISEEDKLSQEGSDQIAIQTPANFYSPQGGVNENLDKGIVVSEGAGYGFPNDRSEESCMAVARASGVSKDFQSIVQLRSIQTTEIDHLKTSCPETVKLPTTDAKNERGDLSHCSRRHIALKVMYLGASVHGFTSDSSTKRTIESELFAALEKTKLLTGGRLDAKYSRCGRTDKGVSANGQVIALYLRSSQKDSTPMNCSDPGTNNDVCNQSIRKEDRVKAAKASRSQESHFATASDEQEIDYVGTLNRALPLDIRILGWCYVPDDFHARFSCIYREYNYFFINDGLDIEAMKLAGRKFEGEHDFRNFCKMDADNVHNFRRKILAFDIVPCKDRWPGLQLWMFRVKGTAFLWHQVRCMVAVLLMIGQQNESPSIVDELLDVQKTVRKPQYLMAPDSDLVLESCAFQGLSFFCSSGSARLLHLHFENLMKEHLLRAAMLKEAYGQLPYINENCSRQGLQKKVIHVPLSCRPTEPSYEERRSKLKKGKKEAPVS